jgi:hypothetical protein
MIVDKLDQMEKIVSKNKALFWDGWTVVNIYKSDKAKSSKYGMYINGQWYMSKRFEPSRNGWDIPERLVLGHAQT